MQRYARLASLVAVICLASLSRGNWGIIYELEKVLSVAGDDGQLLAMFAHCIKLIIESCLEFLTRNVRKLGLGDQRLSLSADKFLLKDNNLRRVGLLVLELRNLVGDLLFACDIVSIIEIACTSATYGHDWVGRRLRCYGYS